MPNFSQSFDSPPSTPDSPKPPKHRRTRIKGTKVDVGKAYLMKERGLTLTEIAQRFDADKSTVSDALKRFTERLPHPEMVKHYEEHRPNLLTAAELLLVEDIADPDRRAKASLNNTAYALTQVSNLRRLEQGKATSHVAILQLAASQADTQDSGDD